MKFKINTLVTLFALLTAGCERTQLPYTVSGNSVKEGNYTAIAHSPEEMHSNYPMETDLSIPQPIIFKLSLNGRDNEAGFGQDHHLVIPEGVSEFYAPTLRFGVQSMPPAMTQPAIQSPINVHFRVDLRPVLKAFSRDSYYVTPTSDTIHFDDFEGLYIAGGTPPLQWIWDLPEAPEALKFTDADMDSIYELSIHIAPPTLDEQERSWALKEDISGLPEFSSPEAPLLEALTNMALEEAKLNIRDDGAFSAGKEWVGVWTRDISYAAQLSLAYLFPENIKTSLRAKLTEAGRIIQDTGTGGSWPISSDRHLWTMAAWEVYLATGDETWLDEIREPVINALQEDLLWNRDPVSGMLLGETSFEDWREQTYPVWMSPADIHASHALSTNIIFKRALEIGLFLVKNDKAIIQSWPSLIQRLDQSILQHFWSEALNAPASYVMASPAWVPAPHRDLLGESLGILYMQSFGRVDSQLVASYPRTAIGSPVISHQLPHSPPYHNKAIWPFVETYGLLAAKKAGNDAAYAHGFNGLIRSAALFLSHRENYAYESGRPDQTQINSDRQLWSVGGWLGAIYKGLFGITISYDFERHGFNLQVSPNNPFEWDGFSLTELTLHDTPISMMLKGRGSVIQTLTVNGVSLETDQSIPLLGEALDIVVELTQAERDGRNQIVLTNHLLPEVPDIQWTNDTLSWRSASPTTVLALNGQFLDTLEQTAVIIPDSLNGFFSVISYDSTGKAGLPSKPHYLGPSATLMLSPKEPYFIELGNENTFMDMNFTVPNAGNYLLRFIYSNGAGPINTGNTCGLAKLLINDWWLEQMISFPHTGSWDQLSTTAWAKAAFQAGENRIELNTESLPVNNMHGKQNQFRILSVEIIPL